jgi:hypothetical protein
MVESSSMECDNYIVLQNVVAALICLCFLFYATYCTNANARSTCVPGSTLDWSSNRAWSYPWHQGVWLKALSAQLCPFQLTLGSWSFEILDASFYGADCDPQG